MFIARTLLVLFALISPALAQDSKKDSVKDGPRSAAIAADAAQAFRSYLDGAAAKGERPDLAKPEVAAMLGRINDMAALKALPHVAGSDLPWLVTWMQAANNTNKALITFGMKPGSQPDLVLIGRNMSDYQDQVAANANFLIHGQAREAAAMKLFMAGLAPEQRTPVREQALAGFSSSMAGTIVNEIGGVVLGGKPANARLVAAAFRDTRADWASALLPADRDRLLAQLPAMTAQVKDDTARADLAAFTAAFKEGK